MDTSCRHSKDEEISPKYNTTDYTLTNFAGYEGMEEIVDRQCNTKISVNLKISDESIFITHIRC